MPSSAAPLLGLAPARPGGPEQREHHGQHNERKVQAPEYNQEEHAAKGLEDIRARPQVDDCREECAQAAVQDGQADVLECRGRALIAHHPWLQRSALLAGARAREGDNARASVESPRVWGGVWGVQQPCRRAGRGVARFGLASAARAAHSKEELRNAWRARELNESTLCAFFDDFLFRMDGK